MRHLIIAAHPRAKSFNRSVVAAYSAALSERGHRVACRDLYALGFKAVMSARDLAAITRGRPPTDIRAELTAIRAADAVTLIAPLWWSGFPAMLKGYIDRVLFAYVNARQTPSRKKGAVILTSEASVAELRSDGALRALRTHHAGILDYCGIKLAGQLHLGGIAAGMSRTAGEKHLDAVRSFARRTF